MIVLGVILAISAYSLYFVARHLGVPKIFAIGMSTAFDGTAMILAQQSLARAIAGISSAAPKLWMYLFAGLSSWLNSLHALLGHETLLAVPLWAGLPIGAVVVFDINTSFARRKALVQSGRQYADRLPKFGVASWVFFPANALTSMRTIVGRRMKAVTDHAIARADAQPVTGSVTRPRKTIPARSVTEPEPGSATPEPATVVATVETIREESDAPGLSQIVTCESPDCGETFIRRRSDQRYCGSRCRTAATRARQREAEG
jgi:hypothetical protein